MTPYLPVEDFANIILPANAHPRVLVMLAVYLDASNTEKGRSFVTVAGCLATVERWKTFQTKWQALLDKEGLPFFHMTDFEGYHGHYKGWTQKRHKHVFRKVAKAIVGRVDFAFSRGVAHDDFEWAQTQQPILSHWSAFTFCAAQCLHAVANWAIKHNHDGPIAYIFESGDGFDGELNEFKTLIESSEDRMKRFRWAGLYILPKVKANPPFPLTPLQAADVWAFEARKEWENYHSTGVRSRAVRKSARLLLGKGVEIDFGFSPRRNLVTLEPYWQMDT